jgi:hypothetical protein
MAEIPFYIHDMDEHQEHCLFVKRPSPNEPPIAYVVSFQSTKGKDVQYKFWVHSKTDAYTITVKGRFVIE